jgi:sec-independent protein translocase protein TatC
MLTPFVTSKAPRHRGGRHAPDGTMTLGDHLVEAKRRGLIAVGALVIAAIAGFMVSETVLEVLQAPLAAVAGTQVSLNYTSLTGAFDLRIQIAITVGVVIASPVWLYQVLAFISPAMDKRNKRRVLVALACVIPLFVGGAYAGAFLFPHVVVAMTSFVNDGATMLLDAKLFLDFALKLIIVSGVAFVLPAILVFANRAGAITGVSILRGWRWALMSITLFTAFATPAGDVLSMLLLALPMIALYLGACAIAIGHDKNVARRALAADSTREAIV